MASSTTPSGSTGLREFVRFDHRGILRKAPGAERRTEPSGGDPLIMKEMAKHVPDACSYAPVRWRATDSKIEAFHGSFMKAAVLTNLSPVRS
jgi:hypothetical protein